MSREYQVGGQFINETAAIQYQVGESLVNETVSGGGGGGGTVGRIVTINQAVRRASTF